MGSRLWQLLLLWSISHERTYVALQVGVIRVRRNPMEAWPIEDNAHWRSSGLCLGSR